MADGQLDRALEVRILELLAQRGAGKTICPSDAARSVHADRGDADPEGWRALMDATRSAAGRLVAAGQVVVTQDGAPVDIDEARGPVRIRRA